MHPEADGYHETLRAPLSWWLLGAGFAAMVWWACFVATPAWVAWLAGAGSLALVAAALWAYGRASVCAADDGLYAGRAHLPWRYVGDVASLDAATTRRLLGVDADARAHLLVRSYCRRAVRIEVADAADPAPYWLVSSRHPDDLAASLTGHRVSD